MQTFYFLSLFLVQTWISTTEAGCGNCLSPNDNPVVDAAFKSGGFYATGNPCFLKDGGRWCITSISGTTSSFGYGMGSCDENDPACGAIKGAAEPKLPSCDNAQATNNLPKKYCDLTIDGIQNTMCEITGMGATCNSQVCDNPGPTGITNAGDIQKILDAHNKYRRNVAKGLQKGMNGEVLPAATNMMEIKWNQDLAESAQRWSDTCKFGHDKNRCVKAPCDSMTNPGQNAATINRPPTGIIMDDPTDRWFLGEIPFVTKEYVSKFPENCGTCPPNEAIGHATQVMWAETKEVGCGYVTYKDAAGDIQGVFNCNYFPGGNMIDGAVYTAGETGSACTGGTNDGLCKW